MARRDLRQFGLADSIVQRRGKKTAWLEQLDAALDWSAIEMIIEGIYASREGGLSYPLLTYVKLLLLQQWCGLSDEGLEAAVKPALRPAQPDRGDRLSFRRFAGIPLAEAVPGHSSIWRFREQLARRGLAERLLAEINRQLDTRGLIIRRGTLIDATILEAAVRPPGGNADEVSPRDPQAGWTKKNGKSRSGYKAHAAVDEGSGLVRQVVTAPADVHDSVKADDLVLGDEAAVYADKAHDDAARRERLRAQGIEPRIMPKARRNRPLKPWQVALNKAVAPIRAGGGRAAARDHEAELRLPPGALPGPGPQRRPGAGPVHRHQPAPGARPWAGLREEPVRCGAGRVKRSGNDELRTGLTHRWASCIA